MLPLLVLTSFLFALVPALLFRSNLRAYAALPAVDARAEVPFVSVLIPARNEEQSIGRCVRSVLASTGVVLELIVLDDGSEDRTGQVVAKIAAEDDRLRLVSAPALPPGWCGKQHACWVLAHEARAPWLVFIDADVRLAPDAIARMCRFVSATGAGLASGIPRQETVGLLEKLLIPLIHFILLGFLPIRRMRRSVHPRFAAGCGQLFIARAEAYQRAGGHAMIRTTLHDGLKLPRVFRAAGFRTDLFDATSLATCRMYHSAGDVWHGLAKNATEGLAAPAMIVPFTVALAMGQVLPLVLLAMGICSWPAPWHGWELLLALAAALLAYYPRLAGVARFRQSPAGALLHPLGIAILLAIQWYAFLMSALGRPSTWKGRPYQRPGEAAETVAAREMEAAL